MPGLYEKTKARTSIHDTIIDTKIQESVKIKAGSKRKSEEVNGNLKLFVAVKKKKLYNRTMDKKIKTENTETIRINKYLSNAGVCSRRDADQFTDAGRVTLDGTAIKTGERIPIDAVVCLDGHPITKEEKKVLLLFYKPRGIVCSTKKQRNETTVTEYLDYPLRVYPVGRLDKDSEGLLLLTNQGDLVNRIMRAGNYHEKEYLVTVNKEITEDFLKGMRGGVPILDTVTRTCTVKKTGRRSFQIILTQGLNRQIRRMCEYFGYQVQTLKRVRIMNLTLDGLDPGEYREIRKEEWKELEKQIRNSSSETIKETGGHHGNSSRKPNERTGKKTERSGKGLLSGRPGDHEQQRVRRSVRSAGANGSRNRHRSGRQSDC